jgi:hypothetical protein
MAMSCSAVWWPTAVICIAFRATCWGHLELRVDRALGGPGPQHRRGLRFELFALGGRASGPAGRQGDAVSAPDTADGPVAGEPADRSSVIHTESRASGFP